MFAEQTPPLCLFGAGGHGRVVGAIAARIWPREVIFGDDNRALGTLVEGIPVEVSDLGEVQSHHVIVTVGNTAARRTLQARAEKLGLSCTYLIANPDGYFADTPGEGSMILTAALVNPGARIGRGVIVNTAAVVEHDCIVGDFCHLAPRSVMLGGCTLGHDVWLGANSTVLEGVSICPNVTIGAGAVVTRNITAPGTYAGVPACKINDKSALTPPL